MLPVLQLGRHQFYISGNPDHDVQGAQAVVGCYDRFEPSDDIHQEFVTSLEELLGCLAAVRPKKKRKLALESLPSPTLPGDKQVGSPIVVASVGGDFAIGREEGVAWMKHEPHGQWSGDLIACGADADAIAFDATGTRLLVTTTRLTSTNDLERNTFLCTSPGSAPLKLPRPWERFRSDDPMVDGLDLGDQALSTAGFSGDEIVVEFAGQVMFVYQYRGGNELEIIERIDRQVVGLPPTRRPYFVRSFTTSGQLLAIAGYEEVLIYDRDDKKTQTLTKNGELLNLESVTGGVESLAMSERYLVMGVPSDTARQSGLNDARVAERASNVGSATVYQRNEAGQWVYLRTLRPEDGQPQRSFGACVGVVDNRFLVATIRRSASAPRENVTTIIEHQNDGELVYLAVLPICSQDVGGRSHQHVAICRDYVLEHDYQADRVNAYRLPR